MHASQLIQGCSFPPYHAHLAGCHGPFHTGICKPFDPPPGNRLLVASTIAIIHIQHQALTPARTPPSLPSFFPSSRFQLRCVLAQPIVVLQPNAILRGSMRLVAHERQSYSVAITLTGPPLQPGGPLQQARPRFSHTRRVPYHSKVTRHLCVCFALNCSSVWLCCLRQNAVLLLMSGLCCMQCILFSLLCCAPCAPVPNQVLKPIPHTAYLYPSCLLPQSFMPPSAIPHAPQLSPAPCAPQSSGHYDLKEPYYRQLTNWYTYQQQQQQLHVQMQIPEAVQPAHQQQAPQQQHMYGYQQFPAQQNVGQQWHQQY